MKHFSHEHGLVLKNADNGSHICCHCGEPISGSFYLCEEECRYYLHKVCAELPNDINHPIRQTCTLPPATINCSDHDHQLTLLQNQFHEKKELICNICYEDMTTHETVYSCDESLECMFFAHGSCAKSSKTQPSSLEIEMKHFSHKHRLVLKEDKKGSHECYGCGEPILGRFYRCKKECNYYLHKVCAELPTTMNHPMHPEHLLTLLDKAQPDEPRTPSLSSSNSFRCAMCKQWHRIDRFVYNCSICSLNLDMICATASHTIKDNCHMHPLTPVLLPSSFLCNICRTEEKSVSYKCSVCPFWVHQKCTLLPRTVKCSNHHHQLTLLPSIPHQFHKKLDFECIICEQIMTTYGTVYACIGCLFFVHESCATSSEIQPSSTSSLESEINHFSHEHLLVLKKAVKMKTNNFSYVCKGCHEPISGPFYICKEKCRYYLHKVCAELPTKMNHPMHPEHHLTLLAKAQPDEPRTPSYSSWNSFRCEMCMQWHNVYIFVYNCSKCSFNLDMICAIASHTIEDKCHMHPLTPVQLLPASFTCNICRKKEEGASYKCSICPFWVHQNCTFLPATVECSDHDHELILLTSVPNECHEKLGPDFFCDICYDEMTAYETVFSCVGCLFFAHASCAILSRDETIVIDLETKLLPMRKNWTSLISMIEGEENICEVCEQLISDCKCCSKLPEQIPNSNKILECEIDHFSHDHMLHLLDNDNVCAKMCDACAEHISDPSYGCTQCDYFLHKCCIDLPKQISHPFHSKHVIKLFARYPNNTLGMFFCRCCFQFCNTFGYKCDYKRCDFTIDLKCASLSGRITHEAHKHTLFANSVKEIDAGCSACIYSNSSLALDCESCSLTLCLYCTMLPAIVKHRYCKCEGFKLRYSPLKDYQTNYYCDLCEETLNPKLWFYHCGECDQFSHTACLIRDAGDSNIKFGKSYSLPEEHEHMLILTRFTYEYSNCKKCGESLTKDFAVGFECATCPYFKIHGDCDES